MPGARQGQQIATEIGDREGGNGEVIKGKKTGQLQPEQNKMRRERCGWEGLEGKRHKVSKAGR